MPLTAWFAKLNFAAGWFDLADSKFHPHHHPISLANKPASMYCHGTERGLQRVAEPNANKKPGAGGVRHPNANVAPMQKRARERPPVTPVWSIDQQKKRLPPVGATSGVKLCCTRKRGDFVYPDCLDFAAGSTSFLPRSPSPLSLAGAGCEIN